MVSRGGEMNWEAISEDEIEREKQVIEAMRAGADQLEIQNKLLEKITELLKPLGRIKQ